MPGVRDMVQAHPTAGGHGCNARDWASPDESVWAHQAPSAARALKRARAGGVSRRDFLLQGYQCGVGGLRTVELVVRHPVQLLGREVHVLMDVVIKWTS